MQKYLSLTKKKELAAVAKVPFTVEKEHEICCFKKVGLIVLQMNVILMSPDIH